MQIEMSMQHWWNDTERGKLKCSETNCPSLTLSHQLTLDRTRVSAVGGRRLTASVIEYSHCEDQAKPSQSSNWGAETCAKWQSTSRCQPFLLLTAQLGSITDTLTLTGEYAYANDFEVRLMALTDLAKEQRLAPRWPWTNYGRDKIYLVGCLGSEPRLALSQNWGYAPFFQELRRSRRAWGVGVGVRTVPQLCIVYPGICLTTEKITENPHCEDYSALHILFSSVLTENSVCFRW